VTTLEHYIPGEVVHSTCTESKKLTCQ